MDDHLKRFCVHFHVMLTIRKKMIVFYYIHGEKIVAFNIKIELMSIEIIVLFKMFPISNLSLL